MSYYAPEGENIHVVVVRKRNTLRGTLESEEDETNTRRHQTVNRVRATPFQVTMNTILSIFTNFFGIMGNQSCRSARSD